MRERFGRTACIPIRVVVGGIQYFYGGPLPRLRDGTVGDLIVQESDLLDQRDVALLKQEQSVVLLPADSKVLLPVNPRGDTEGVIVADSHGRCLPSFATAGWVETVLKGELRLRLRGTKSGILEPVPCLIPAISRQAISVNEAYRLVSERYEPNRRSHSGNVFELAHCWLGRWRSLGELRDEVQAAHEKRLKRQA
jgi:hypothetical protein